MKYNLHNSKELINFFNLLFNSEFKNGELNDKAIEIMKFLIITRNYGLINLDESINKIYNNDLIGAIMDAFTNGFKQDNIEFNKKNLIETIIKNYDENGYYFHFFPGTYEKSIKEQGIITNNKTAADNTFYEIIKKYQFGTYFERSQNRICLTASLNQINTQYAIFTPEWLEMFLGSWNIDTYDIFENRDLNEIKNTFNTISKNIKTFMKQNAHYKEEEFQFIINYINNVIDNRFKNGNSLIGVAIIPRKQINNLLPERKSTANNDELINYLNNLSYHQIIKLLIERILTEQEITIKQNIPTNLFETIVYSINQKKEYNKNHK